MFKCKSIFKFLGFHTWRSVQMFPVMGVSAFCENHGNIQTGLDLYLKKKIYHVGSVFYIYIYISVFDQLVTRMRETFGHKTLLIVRASLRDLSS